MKSSKIFVRICSLLALAPTARFNKTSTSRLIEMALLYFYSTDKLQLLYDKTILLNGLQKHPIKCFTSPFLGPL